jgi:hypothetical protein
MVLECVEGLKINRIMWMIYFLRFWRKEPMNKKNKLVREIRNLTTEGYHCKETKDVDLDSPCGRNAGDRR